MSARTICGDCIRRSAASYSSGEVITVVMRHEVDAMISDITSQYSKTAAGVRSTLK